MLSVLLKDTSAGHATLLSYYNKYEQIKNGKVLIVINFKCCCMPKKKKKS